MELTLANAPLDLQITICIFSHPSDILSLRKTCKALELATRKRIVWMTVLHRVCLENTLFLPSFPIPDMSDLELERAAMAPRRWIKFCGAFLKQHSNDFSERLRPRTTNIIKDLRPRTTRIIKDSVRSLFIVPGGRYLVTTGSGISVWDLGYVSTVDCKLVASVGSEDDNYYFCKVQATPDGKGLVILSSNIIPYPPHTRHLSIFEIYPQSEVPLLTQIAHLDWRTYMENPAHLLPDILIFRVFHEDRIVFRVVDYRTRYSTCFSADVNVKRIELKHNVETFATMTAIIVLCGEGILIWAIPPLSTQPSDLPDSFLDNNPTHILPIFRIPFSDGILRQSHKILEWMTVTSWYFGSESIYFDIFYTDSKLLRFKIVVKPDLSDASLHFVKEMNNISDGLMKSLCSLSLSHSEGYRICEDALVYVWSYYLKPRTWGAYTGLTSAPFTNFVTQWKGYVDSLCPTSGRLVHHAENGSRARIVVVDLF